MALQRPLFEARAPIRRGVDLVSPPRRPSGRLLNPGPEFDQNLQLLGDSHRVNARREQYTRHTEPRAQCRQLRATAPPQIRGEDDPSGLFGKLWNPLLVFHTGLVLVQIVLDPDWLVQRNQFPQPLARRLAEVLIEEIPRCYAARNPM